MLEDSGLGASIAVNGCCLTLIEKGADWWLADVSEETYSRTNLGALQPGDPVIIMTNGGKVRVTRAPMTAPQVMPQVVPNNNQMPTPVPGTRN